MTLDSTASALHPSGVPDYYGDEGYNNANPDITKARLIKGASYKDLSCIMVVPTRTDGMLNGHVADAINGLIKPMNGAFFKFPFESFRVAGHEVGRAYDAALQTVKTNPQLAKYTFLLTVEHDNIPPPDGLTKLMSCMYEHADYDEDGRIKRDQDGILQFHFLAVGGLYYTKSFAGSPDLYSQPMIYGHPGENPPNFRPQLPVVNALQECRGVAMGFTLYNLSALLNDKRLGPPWFETKNTFDPAIGLVTAGTQDLVFCGKANGLGYRFAVNTDCKVGHKDLDTGLVW